jgi:hypothetical protein
VVRPGRASALGGVVVYGGSGSCGVGSDVVLVDLSDERMTDEDVVDQFLVAPVDSAESLLGRDARGEVPKPLRVTVVGAVKAACTNLRAGRPVDDLSSGGLHLVVEVAEHDNGTLWMVGEEISGGGAHGGGFGAATVERVGGAPPTRSGCCPLARLRLTDNRRWSACAATARSDSGPHQCPRRHSSRRLP